LQRVCGFDIHCQYLFMKEKTMWTISEVQSTTPIDTAEYAENNINIIMTKIIDGLEIAMQIAATFQIGFSGVIITDTKERKKELLNTINEVDLIKHINKLLL